MSLEKNRGHLMSMNIRSVNYMHIIKLNIVRWYAHTPIIPIIAWSSSFSSRFNKISTKFVVVKLSTILFPFQHSMKMFKRQFSISFLMSFNCLSSPCKSNGFKIGMRSLMLGLATSTPMFEMELKNLTILF
jgi:hypothetical protein